MARFDPELQIRFRILTANPRWKVPVMDTATQFFCHSRRDDDVPRPSTRRGFLGAAALLALGAPTRAVELPDMSTVSPDLGTPLCEEGPPRPGRRVRQQLPAYRGTGVYHTLYLPTDWKPGRLYPVLVEYAGNGPYMNRFGDVSTGRPEGSSLGFGLSGGAGYVWVCLPYVNSSTREIQTQWWGDADATTSYAREATPWLCREYGGDPGRVILCGFSRGAIGCGYLGLRDDATSALWSGFVAYSHFDGVRPWPYAGAEPGAAIGRLKRLGNRPFLITDEASTRATREFLTQHQVAGRFTYVDSPFRNHNDAWLLRPTPERDRIRKWLRSAVGSGDLH